MSFQRFRLNIGGEFCILKKRLHGSVIHLDIKDGRVWIQHDGASDGIADELVEAGIPKEHIVLGFRYPKFRKYTEYAAIEI